MILFLLACVDVTLQNLDDPQSRQEVLDLGVPPRTIWCEGSQGAVQGRLIGVGDEWAQYTATSAETDFDWTCNRVDLSEGPAWCIVETLGRPTREQLLCDPEA